MLKKWPINITQEKLSDFCAHRAVDSNRNGIDVHRLFLPIFSFGYYTADLIALESIMIANLSVITDI